MRQCAYEYEYVNSERTIEEQRAARSERAAAVVEIRINRRARTEGRLRSSARHSSRAISAAFHFKQNSEGDFHRSVGRFYQRRSGASQFIEEAVKAD